MVCQRCRGSASEPDLEAGHSTMELVGYQTSHKEMWGSPEKKSNLQYPVLPNKLVASAWIPCPTGEGPESKEEWLPRPNRGKSFEEALRAAHKRALDTAKVLWDDIKR